VTNKNANVNDSGDFITLLEPWNGSVVKDGPSYIHPGKAFVHGEKTSFDVRHKYYRPQIIRVNNIRELSSVLGEESYRARGFVVRGRPNKLGIVRRTCAIGPGKKPHLDEVRHHWCMLDIDGIPNIWNSDPASDPALAWRVRCVLPGDFAQARCHYEASSSARMVEDSDGKWKPLPKGHAPERLRLHLWFWMKLAQDTASLKAILTSVNTHMHEWLSLQGRDIPGLFPDIKVAEAHMPHFIAAPKFAYGEHDGLGVGPYDRWEFLDGDLNEVDIASLPTKSATPAAQRKASKVRNQASPQAKEPSPMRMPTAAKLVPLETARNLLDAFKEASLPKSRGDRKAYCMNSLFPARALYEMLSVAQDNMLTKPGWESGVPVGLRSSWMIAMASLAVEKMPLGLSDDQVCQRLQTVAQAGCVCEEWFDSEWKSLGYDRACIARYRELSDAEGRWTRKWMGEDCPAVYRYRKKSLIPLVAASADQVRRLKLTSVAGLDDVRDAKRREQGLKTSDEVVEEYTKHDIEIHQMANAGFSQRDIMKRLGLSRGAVVRALKRKVDFNYQQENITFDEWKDDTLVESVSYCLIARGVDDEHEIAKLIHSDVKVVRHALDVIRIRNGIDKEKAA
jgi:hypothetical protein